MQRLNFVPIIQHYYYYHLTGGQYMKFRVHKLYEMRRVEKCGESPCERLLTAWGHQNNTVASLYMLLYKMHHYQAMRVLLPFSKSLIYLLSGGHEVL